MMKIIHTSGIYPDNAPAFPDQFSNHCKTVMPAVRLYGNFVFGFADHKEELQKYIPRFAQLSGLGNCDAKLLNMSPVAFRRAVFMTSYSKLLFAHFDNDSFGSFARPNGMYPTNPEEKKKQRSEYVARKTSEREARGLDASFTTADEQMFEAWYDWFLRQSRRRQCASEFKAVMETACGDLYVKGTPFALWVDDLKARCISEWTNGDAALFDKLFINHKDPRIEVQFLEVAKQVWALHRMSLAFPNIPERIRMTLGNMVASAKCTSSFSSMHLTYRIINFFIFSVFSSRR
jgi:hypothetical protein